MVLRIVLVKRRSWLLMVDGLEKRVLLLVVLVCVFVMLMQIIRLMRFDEIDHFTWRKERSISRRLGGKAAAAGRLAEGVARGTGFL